MQEKQSITKGRMQLTKVHMMFKHAQKEKIVWFFWANLGPILTEDPLFSARAFLFDKCFLKKKKVRAVLLESS